MRKWEYRVQGAAPGFGGVSAEEAIPSDWSSLEEILDTCGAEGWELAAAIDQGADVGVVFIFKREVK